MKKLLPIEGQVIAPNVKLPRDPRDYGRRQSVPPLKNVTPRSKP